MKGKVIAASAAAILALAATIVRPWEGSSLPVYKDIVGVPTVCYGHTGPDVVVGQPARTPAECEALLTGDLAVAYGHVRRCIVGGTNYQLAAVTSLAFNVGPRAVCGSTLQHKANAGDWNGACAEISRWVYAGGKKVRGLERRRAAERAMCEGWA